MRGAVLGVLLVGMAAAQGVRASGAETGPMPVSDTAPAPAASHATGVPRYRTDLPAPATLHYLLRRSWLSGEGHLRWARTAEGGYELSLEGALAGVKALSQTSSGKVVASGLAPERFTDQRTKGSNTAHFHRDTASITFSSGAEAVPWVAGTQDRLSWMVQLPAIVRGDPARQAPGQTVELHVVGARGDADDWTFRFVGMEEVRTPAGQMPAAKWVREPRRPRDLSVEVWLAPGVQHLPARARLSNDGDALELLLQSSSP